MDGILDDSDETNLFETPPTEKNFNSGRRSTKSTGPEGRGAPRGADVAPRGRPRGPRDGRPRSAERQIGRLGMGVVQAGPGMAHGGGVRLLATGYQPATRAAGDAGGGADARSGDASERKERGRRFSSRGSAGLREATTNGDDERLRDGGEGRTSSGTT
uniref:Uncharacterized protein n=1 Tax=Oryza barthii TaxID=65489 RepID=A0A1V1H8V9_9ORYZ|nr:hypothetical protein [Oryza barthii]